MLINVHIFLHLILVTTLRQMLCLFPFYRWGNRWPESSSNPLRVWDTHISIKTLLQTSSSSLQHPDWGFKNYLDSHSPPFVAPENAYHSSHRGLFPEAWCICTTVDGSDPFSDSLSALLHHCSLVQKAWWRCRREVEHLLIAYWVYELMLICMISFTPQTSNTDKEARAPSMSRCTGSHRYRGINWDLYLRS